MATSSQSTITLQRILDKILPLGDVKPVLADVSGYQLEPFLTICTDVMNIIYAQPFPYKWNEIKLPLFYTNSFQQDYVLLNPDGSSFYGVEWLERGIVVQLTSNTLPKPWSYVEVGRQLTQATATLSQVGMWNNPAFEANTFPNYMLYYGTWGAAPSGTPSLGNDPQPGSIYVSPLLDNTQAPNPITQIIDTNGNIQVVTTYGTCGLVQPTWPVANSAPGVVTNDGTTKWTVADPNGIGIRILPVPSQTGVIFQFNLVGQQPAPNFDVNTGQGKLNLRQTLAPFPDKYEPYFRQGIIAQCYRYATDPKVQAKFEKNYQIWLKSLVDLRELQDRELEENGFSPEQGIMGRGGSGYGSWPDRPSAAWPFRY